ncbi:MAG: EAL domain-containing protein [Synergistaceae bacterium]|nr:EAL domain-containing protein [Synergistaceae bacterium]
MSSNGTMTSIRQGLVGMMPLMIIGSFAVLVNFIPLDFFQKFMLDMWGPKWKGIAGSIYNGTTQVMSLGVLLSVSYCVARSKSPVKMGQVSPLIVALVSLGCLVTVTNVSGGGIMFVQIGPMGLLPAIFVAVSSTSLFFFFYRRKLFRIRLFTDAADMMLLQSLAALEPAMWTFLVFAAVRFTPTLFGVNDLHLFIYEMLKSAFTFFQSTLTSALLFVFSVHIFWFCGLHGSNVMENVTRELWVPKLAENLAALQAGEVPQEIFSKQFFDVYVLLGGSGSTFCLIAALLIVSGKTNTSKLAKISIPLALFNINETLIYGIPIVFNPFYVVPFILTPVALAMASYLATVTGLVPVITGDVVWTTPILIGGYVATASWRGAALQLFNLLTGTLIYLPFVRINEKFKEEENRKVLEKLNEQVNYVDNHRLPMVLHRPDEVGSLARVLANDLKTDAVDNTGLYLVFQPQVDNAGDVVGCEALLRWRHYRFGVIPPPTIITISEEAGLDDILNRWIFETSLRQLSELNQLGYRDITMSVNVSPLQLHNPAIVTTFQRLIREYRLDPSEIEVELTENIAFDESKESKNVLGRFKKMGMKLAIDDFGMGHTSLLYLRSFEPDTVKLDGSLVQDVMTDRSSVDIIQAVVNLCDNMGIHVIAEVVETRAQRDRLRYLGCHCYQGYYYSRPLEINNFIQFLQSNDCRKK